MIPFIGSNVRLPTLVYLLMLAGHHGTTSEASREGKRPMVCPKPLGKKGKVYIFYAIFNLYFVTLH